MVGQVLGSNPLSGGMGNPMSALQSASPLGQAAGGFSSLIPMLSQALKGNLGNPVTTNQMNAPQPFSALPQVANTGMGSQGGTGNQGANFVSQDERSSVGDRLGLPTNVPPPLAAKGAAQPVAGGEPPPTAVQQQASDPYAIPPAIKAGIFKGESGGNYDTLFGHAEAPGGQFAGTKVSNMTVDQAIQFSNPHGQYAQYVLQHNPTGKLATPMGAYQVVGNTLQQAKAGLGLTGNEVMTPQLQDKIGGWIYQNQGTGAWAGYKGPAVPPDPSRPFQPGEKLYVPAGPGRSGHSGQGVMVTLPGGDASGSGIGVASNGDENTATTAGAAVNETAARRARMAKLAAGSPGGVGPQLPQTRPPMQDQNNPAYQQQQASRHASHSRALPAVDVVKGLASIGKGYRDNAGSTYG